MVIKVATLYSRDSTGSMNPQRSCIWIWIDEDGYMDGWIEVDRAGRGRGGCKGSNWQLDVDINSIMIKNHYK